MTETIPKPNACFILGCEGTITFMEGICPTCGWHRCSGSQTQIGGHCLCTLTPETAYAVRVVEMTTIDRFKSRKG